MVWEDGVLSNQSLQCTPPPLPRTVHQPARLSHKVHRTFKDTAIENGGHSTAGEALFYEFTGKQHRVTDKETGIEVVTCMVTRSLLLRFTQPCCEHGQIVAALGTKKLWLSPVKWIC